ncbi:hypothetical protein PR048_027972 [Dryococelus australis]|uniref:Uncharacterized protein n=1 Tax=Dryococelus australis TaxID=614101 RepID=A0ABQ9GHZ8_9NEOP|nr:hypothetical protein PR048_027972 [Dryococelus australis]
MDGKITFRRVHLFSIIPTAKWEDGRKKKQSSNTLIFNHAVMLSSWSWSLEPKQSHSDKQRHGKKSLVRTRRRIHLSDFGTPRKTEFRIRRLVSESSGYLPTVPPRSKKKKFWIATIFTLRCVSGNITGMILTMPDFRVNDAVDEFLGVESFQSFLSTTNTAKGNDEPPLHHAAKETLRWQQAGQHDAIYHHELQLQSEDNRAGGGAVVYHRTRITEEPASGDGMRWRWSSNGIQGDEETGVDRKNLMSRATATSATLPLEMGNDPAVNGTPCLQNWAKAVHDQVSTSEINLRKKSLLLPAYILTDALSDMRPLQLVTLDGNEVSTEERRNAMAGETGDPRENPPNNGIVRHDPHRRKSGGSPAGNRTRFALVGGKWSDRYVTPPPPYMKLPKFLSYWPRLIKINQRVSSAIIFTSGSSEHSTKLIKQPHIACTYDALLYLLPPFAVSFTHESSPIVQPASRTLHCLILAVADFPSADHFSRCSSSIARNSPTHSLNSLARKPRRTPVRGKMRRLTFKYSVKLTAQTLIRISVIAEDCPNDEGCAYLKYRFDFPTGIAAHAQAVLKYHPERRLTAFDSWRGRPRIFACGNRAGRCRWSAGLPRRSPVSPRLCVPALLHSDSPRFTLIGSQDLDVKVLFYLELSSAFEAEKRHYAQGQYTGRTFNSVAGQCVFKTLCDAVQATAISTLASHQSEPGSIPVWVTRFSQVEIVPLVTVPSRGPPASHPPPPNFRHRSIFTSITLIDSEDLDSPLRYRCGTAACIATYSHTCLRTGAAVAQRLDRSSQTKTTRDLSFPSPLHCGAAPCSHRFTLIGFQDLDVTEPPRPPHYRLFTVGDRLFPSPPCSFLGGSRVPASDTFGNVRAFPQQFLPGNPSAERAPRVQSKARALGAARRVRCKKVGRGMSGGGRRKLAKQIVGERAARPGVVHLRIEVITDKNYSPTAAIRPRECNEACFIDTYATFSFLRARRGRVQYNSRTHEVAESQTWAADLLAVRIEDMTTTAVRTDIKARSLPGFSQVRMVPEDAAGRRVFSGISRFPRPCIPALLHTKRTSASSALRTSRLRAADVWDDVDVWQRDILIQYEQITCEDQMTVPSVKTVISQINYNRVSEKIWAARNIEVMRADEGEARNHIAATNPTRHDKKAATKRQLKFRCNCLNYSTTQQNRHATLDILPNYLEGANRL